MPESWRDLKYEAEMQDAGCFQLQLSLLRPTINLCFLAKLYGLFLFYDRGVYKAAGVWIVQMVSPQFTSCFTDIIWCVILWQYLQVTEPVIPLICSHKRGGRLGLCWDTRLLLTTNWDQDWPKQTGLNIFRKRSVTVSRLWTPVWDLCKIHKVIMIICC